MDKQTPPTGGAPAISEETPGRQLRFDRAEWAAAFADLGTFIPFVLAYVTVLKLDPVGILLAFGAALVCCGFVYRTPIPVQPMKAIGALAASHAGITGASIMAASMVTGAIWLLLGLTGAASRLARIVPSEVVSGIMVGLGLSFMLQGAAHDEQRLACRRHGIHRCRRAPEKSAVPGDARAAGRRRRP